MTGKALRFLAWGGYEDEKIYRDFHAQHPEARVEIELIRVEPEDAQDVLSGRRSFDLVSLNQPFAGKIMESGLAEPLQDDLLKVFDGFYENFHHPYRWAVYNDKVYGLPLRFGWMGYVADMLKLRASDLQSYEFFWKPANAGRYGVLDWFDWTSAAVFMYLGIEPFRSHSEEERNQYYKALVELFSNAKIVRNFRDASCCLDLNKQLLSGTIDAYIPGGTFTTASLRQSGQKDFETILPSKNVPNGRGGILWVEITLKMKNARDSLLVDELLQYIFQPRTEFLISLANSSPNPVVDKRVLQLYEEEDKRILELNRIDEAFKKCVEYSGIPDLEELKPLYEKARSGRFRKSAQPYR